MTENDTKKIKYLVLSGGAVVGFSFYGILRESNKNGDWNIKDIKSIYGTSTGAIFGLIIALNFDWDVIDDYVIKRPWQNVFQFNIQNIFTFFDKRGIFDVKIIEEIFTPLFLAKDIPINVTMKEFFELTGIDMRFFSVNINNFSVIEFSHENYPDWRIVDAVYCSCCLPVLFRPLLNKDICYTDGGMLCNYPVNYCIERGADPEEIFGICRKPVMSLNYNVNEESTLFDYIINIFYKTIEKVLNPPKIIKIGHELFVNCPPLAINDIFNTSSSAEERIRLIQIGVDAYEEKRNG